MNHILEPVPNLEGLVYCTVCNGAENSLATDCPGADVTQEQLEQIADQEVDFIGGKWVKLVRVSCGDECGTERAVPQTETPAGWIWLDVARKWRCPRCQKALEAVGGG